MALRPLVLALVLVLAAGCGSTGGADLGKPRTTATTPPLAGTAEPPPAAAAHSGFPALATKNTTRVSGGDPIATAAGVALAVYPSRSRETRPAAVALVDSGDWRAAISAAQLMSRPLRAPLLFSSRKEVPPATLAAVQALAPTGAKQAGGAQVLRIGAAPGIDGTRARALAGAGYAEQARAIDRLVATASGKPSTVVVVAPADHPEFAMPAAGYAAKAGTPVLWVQGTTVPAATRAAIRDHGKPRIYLLGPQSAIPAAVAADLGKLGKVTRVGARDPAASSVAFARYADSGFGWNAVDPGHGFVFASVERPADAAAAAPLSSSGTYGPLLVITDGARLDRALEGYLLDVQPGYDRDPVRGVYNHGWVMGDPAAISVDVQSRIDALLEIQPVDSRSTP